MTLALGVALMGSQAAFAGENAPREQSASALHVIIVGTNHSYDPAVTDLQYADDDALQFADLLAPYARSVDVLTVLDRTTQQRHPELASRTRLPTRGELLAALGRVRDTIWREREAGAHTSLMFVYVGHGGVDAQGHGFVHLADGPFTRADVFGEILAASSAETTHVVIDACNAFSLVAGRGPGAPAAPHADPFEQFLSGHDLEDYPGVGVLAASSASRETHEWSAIRGGLFSHQVRSALSGAADVNGDGLLEYSEVAAFVAAANLDVPEDANRLAVFAWPPLRDRHAPLLDLRSLARQHRVVLGEEVAGHLFVESDSGAPWAELNKPVGSVLALALPADRSFFLRAGRRELEIRAGAVTTSVRAIPSAASIVSARGAVDRALGRALFDTPFDQGFYRGYVAAAPNLLPVATVGGREEPTASVPTELPVELAVGYRLSRYPLATGYLEHGLSATVRVPLADTWLALVELEAARSSLTALVAQVGSRGALSMGVGYRVQPASWLRLSTQVQLGYQALFLGDGFSNADWAGGLARIRLGLSARVAEGLWLEVGPSYSTNIVTIDGGSHLRDRAELLVALGW